GTRRPPYGGRNPVNIQLNMALPNIDPTTTKAWKKLQIHFEETRELGLGERFASDPERGRKFSLVWEDFLLDYSKNLIDDRTRSLLLELATESGLDQAIAAQFEG